MNTYADEIRRRAEDAPRAALPAVIAALWRAFGEGHVTEAEAEALSALIEARQTSAARRSESAGSLHAARANLPDSQVKPETSIRSASAGSQRSPRTGVGSRPRSDASLERRRRWAASGRLPPALAARFTLAEHAVLALVAAEAARRGDCRLAVGHIASIAGVSETTVRNAIKEARRLGLLIVEERRVSGFRNLPNVVRIISPEWTAWLRLTRKGQGLNSQPQLLPRRGGCKSANRTPTQISKPGKTGTARSSRGRGAAAGGAL